MKNRISSYTKLALALFTYLFPGLAFAAVDQDPYGWTVITPSVDSLIVYVSESEGNDSNDGLTPSTPKKTIAAGNALIRDGEPDHLLLKRGDVFPASSSVLSRSWKNGRSAQEPIVFSYYGTSGARPVVKFTGVGINHGIGIPGTREPRHYQAYIGIDFYKSNSDPASPDFTNASCSTLFNFVTGGNDLLIEDCVIRFAQVTIQSGDGFEYHRPKVRRNIFFGAWKHNSTYVDNGSTRIQGLFVSGVKDSYLIEENFFDHSGWSGVVEGAGANMYNHNVYVQYDNVAGGIMRGNIFARGSGQGLQARSGGLVDQNLFVLNSVAVNIGYNHQAPTDPDAFMFPNRAQENVILNGRRQNINSWNNPQSGAVWGIWTTDLLPDVLVNDNIVANRTESGTNEAFNGSQYAVMTNNISYEWDSFWDTDDTAWPHPDHDLGDYFSTLGGSNDTIAYLEWLRTRPLGELPWEMTAYSAINYIRDGFNKAAVTPPYLYDGYGSSTWEETFTNLSASTTNQLSSGSYTGDNGESWSYTYTLRVDSGITGVTAQIRRLNGYLQTTLPDGVIDLGFTIQTKPGLPANTARIQVLIGGVDYGTFEPTQVDVPFQVDLLDLDITGPVTLRLNSVGGTEVWIDDIIWAYLSYP